MLEVATDVRKIFPPWWVWWAAGFVAVPVYMVACYLSEWPVPRERNEH
jgi:hypothetical protein